ncbi:MAG: hypothetical protein IPL06_19495 [Betaproteobacteria bacterium]|nr:hypothetical protein [Betaproteobacteria bacterium]
MKKPARRKAAETNGVVREYFERVDGAVLDQYATVVKSLIHRHAGVYALYKGERLYYVGLAKNLMGRVKAHLKDRHARKWNKFSVYLTPDNELIRPLEALVLRVMNPVGNRVKGKLKGAKDIGRTLNVRMSDADADRRARLVGGHVARRRRKTNLGAVRGSLGLAGLLDRRLSLRGTYRGEQFRASLRKDGKIQFRGTIYTSPTMAAKAVVKRAVSGWKFWHYRNSRGGVGAPPRIA